MISSTKRNIKHPNILPKVKEKLALGQLILAGAFVLLSFSSCQLAVANRQLASRSITNVQLADGTAISVQQKNEKYRSPKLLKTFVNQWISLMFSWNGKQTGTEEVDPGVQTTKGGRVPMSAWAASVMMEPEFGEVFLNQWSELIPGEVYSGRFQSAAYVRHLSEPRQVSPTTWEIDVIATRTLFDQSTQTQQPAVSFNRTFTLEAVAIPQSPLEEEANSLERMIYKMRSSGLEITAIEPYTER